MRRLDRRGFIRSIVGGAISLIGAAGLGRAESAGEGPREAMFYERLPGGRIRCLLEPRRCQVSEGERGYCGARENRAGRYYSVVYGRPCAAHPERPENDHFYHVLPGRKLLGVGTAGCNLQCRFCETWEISQARPEEIKSLRLSPEKLVEKALKEGYPGILFTYNEPTVCFEYVLDTARLARERGLKTFVHTAGFISEEPLRELCRYVDGVNVDLKSFRKGFYPRICSAPAEIEEVLGTILVVGEMGVHLEITNLVIPELSDSIDSIGEMCLWIKDNLGGDVPVHFARFFPSYQLAGSHSTPIETLEKAWRTAKGVGLNFVYLDNVGGHEATSTRCPSCGETLIERDGMETRLINLRGGECGRCGRSIPGVWG